MHSIRTDFGFNLLHSASKLKSGVIEKKNNKEQTQITLEKKDHKNVDERRIS
jgi:hypothetical protein